MRRPLSLVLTASCLTASCLTGCASVKLVVDDVSVVRLGDHPEVEYLARQEGADTLAVRIAFHTEKPIEAVASLGFLSARLVGPELPRECRSGAPAIFMGTELSRTPDRIWLPRYNYSTFLFPRLEHDPFRHFPHSSEAKEQPPFRLEQGGYQIVLRLEIPSKLWRVYISDPVEVGAETVLRAIHSRRD